jgi:hypothetical protein
MSVVLYQVHRVLRLAREDDHPILGSFRCRLDLAVVAKTARLPIAVVRKGNGRPSIYLGCK